MGDIVNLRGTPVDISSDVGRQFVVDCTRAGEGVITDRDLQEKYELSPADWKTITKNKELGHAVRAERERRVRSGAAAKESACKHFVRAPNVLAEIMDGETSHPKHKIEAIKELRQTAVGGDDERGPDSERFVIHIDLGGGHIETYDKARKPDGGKLLQGNTDDEEE